MVAYVIFTRERMRDEEMFKEYHRVGRAARGDHPLKRLAYYGDFEVLEGAPTEGVVLFEFPTMEAARAWYNDPAYQKALPLRLQSSDYRVILFEGLPETEKT